MKTPGFDSTGWLAAIVDSSDDAIFSMNLDGVVTSWNAAAVRMFGYQPDEMIGKSIDLLIPTSRHGEESYILGLVRRGERIRHYNTVRRCKDGRLLNVSLRVSPIFDAEQHIVGVSKIARDITEWKIAQETQSLLMRELNHRSKNLLSIVEAIMRQTIKTAPAKQFLERISRRLQALSVNQDMLVEREWRGVDLAVLVMRQITPIVDDAHSRVTVDGPTLLVNPTIAQAISLAIYELAANAVKFGSLSGKSGEVAVTWSLGDGHDGAREFRMSWRESGGPPVSRPRRKGFGSTIIENLVARSILGSATVTYAKPGLIWELVTSETNLLLYDGAAAHEPLVAAHSP